MRIVLDDDDFRKLIAGDIVRKTSQPTSSDVAEIILSDIGWTRMVEIIKDECKRKGKIT